MTKTLHICLSAGVGNRLFQYASIKAISKKYGYTFNIVDNIYDYQHNKKYNWFIDKIKTDFKESKEELTNVFTYDQPYTEHVGVVTTFDFYKST